ncbi:MAG: response regulator, partial [Sphaerospermopsis sp. SIO1G2]|nr:response regulator [Sphaerospermopsis sp. SIO1G2]
SHFPSTTRGSPWSAASSSVVIGRCHVPSAASIGFEVCARLKANPATADIPVIFMTAMSDAENRTKGLREGAVDYVTKPVNVAELRMRVRTHLALHDLQRQLEEDAAQNSRALARQTAELENLRAERATLYEKLSRQTEQIHQLAQQAMQEQITQNEGTRIFFQNHLQANLQQAHDALEQIHVQRRLAHQPTAQNALQTAVDKATEHIQTSLSQVEQLLNQTAASTTITQAELKRKLSDREYETLQLMARGLGNGEIAEQMSVSPGTVTTYRGRIMKKLHVSDTASLLQIAFTINLNHEKQ